MATLDPVDPFQARGGRTHGAARAQTMSPRTPSMLSLVQAINDPVELALGERGRRGGGALERRRVSRLSLRSASA